MRALTIVGTIFALFAALIACSPGTGPTVGTDVPRELQTGVAQAPTVLPDAANTAAAAIQAAATEAARQGGTLVPSVATAVSGAAETAAPAVQTSAAAAQTAVTTVGPAAQTAAASVQTAVATPLIVLPGAATPPPSGRVVEVRLSEYKIEMPDTLPAGPTTFRVTNAGSSEHNFVVEGQGVTRTFDKNLKANETNTLQVNLTTGTFRVYCPVSGHRDLGMLVNLTVTP